MKVLGGDVINVQIVMYNKEQMVSASDIDMSIDAHINCLRIIFLNWFVSSMLVSTLYIDAFTTNIYIFYMYVC